MKCIICLEMLQKKNILGWKPKTSFDDLVKKMVDSDLDLSNREKVLIDNGLMKPTWEYST